MTLQPRCDDQDEQARGGEHGAAAVELALILPLLVTLVFGIAWFGMAYNAKLELSGAVREGARVAALGKSGAAAAVVSAASGLNGFDAGDVDVEHVCTPGDTGDGRVRASYQINYSIPFFGTSTWTLNATGVMRCGL